MEDERSAAAEANGGGGEDVDDSDRPGRAAVNGDHSEGRGGAPDAAPAPAPSAGRRALTPPRARAEPEPIYSVIERLEREIDEHEPIRFNVRKRSRQASPTTTDTFSSRPSSGMSIRSESDLVNSNMEGTSPRVGTGRKSTVDISNPSYRLPFEHGWRRELVYRANLDQNQRRQADIYYYSPGGKKLRSTREVGEHLEGSDLTIDNFTFFKEPLGIDDPEKEIIRGAKLQKSRTDSPQHESSDSNVVEGKRTPKPKAAKGASSAIKVKSVGSRLSMSSSGSAATSPGKSPAGKESGNSTPKSVQKDTALSKKLTYEDTLEAISSSYGVDKNMRYAPGPDKYYYHADAADQHPIQNPHFSPRNFSSAVSSDSPKAHPIPQMKKVPSGPASKPTGGRDMCPMRCPLANKEPPTLQCSLCLCLYHGKCTGFVPIGNAAYVCKNCRSTNSPSSSPPSTPINNVPRPGTKTSPQASGISTQRFSKPIPNKIPQPKLVPVVKKNSPFHQSGKYPKIQDAAKSKCNKMNSAAKTVWPSSVNNKIGESVILPSSNIDQTMFPQSIAIVNGHKFIVVPRPMTSSNSSNQINNPKQGDNAPKVLETNYPIASSTPSVYPLQTLAKSLDAAKEDFKPIKNYPKTTENYPPPTNVINFDNLTAEYGKFLFKGDSSGGGFVNTRAPPPSRSLSSDGNSEDTPVAGTKRKSKGPVPKIIPKIAKKAENGTAGQKVVGRGSKAPDAKKNYFGDFFKANSNIGYSSLIQVFKYLKMRELASAACVCRLWKEIADTPILWESVRMKNSQVNDWEGLAAALKRHGTRHLDLRKMLHQHAQEASDKTWDQFIDHISTVDSLTSLDLCRCPSSVVERVCERMPQLKTLTATSIRCSNLNPEPLSSLKNLIELRIKGMSALKLTGSLKALENLVQLRHLSITSVEELGKYDCASIGKLTMLESLELGECTGNVDATDLLKNLTKLVRLRLEKCPTPDGGTLILNVASELPELRQLELINFDIKPGFEEALGKCSNVKRLLIIPMYVSQSATTNQCVLEGVFGLKSTLTHLVWGVTLELLRVTELFIDQCDRNQAQAGGAAGDAPPAGVPPSSSKPPKKSNGGAAAGDCIPVLKPIPGLPRDDVAPSVVSGRPQVEILPMPQLQRLLATELPRTRVKVLRIPYHHTWRQTFSDFD